MPWCPKCESEFESHVKVCPVCDVELVVDLESVVNYSALVEIPTEEVDNLIEYLNYSGFKMFQFQESEETTQILIPEEDVKEAKRLLGIYLYQRQQEINEELAMSEAEIDDEEKDSAYINTPQRNRMDPQKIDEMHSSVWSFLLLGGILSIIGLLNLFGVAHFLSVKSMVYMCIVIGAAFLAIGVLTKKRIPVYESQLKQQENDILNVKNWFLSQHAKDSYLQEMGILKENLDQGALYFKLMDQIKIELKEKYPQMDEIVLSSAADELVNSILQ